MGSRREEAFGRRGKSLSTFLLNNSIFLGREAQEGRGREEKWRQGRRRRGRRYQGREGSRRIVN